MPAPVIAAVNEHFALEVQSGGYEAAEIQAAKAKGFYSSAARLINAHPEEIAFVESATRAWDMIFYSLSFTASDRIITSEAEYASNFIAYLHVAQKTGVQIDVIPSDASGQICLEQLKRRIDGNVKLIAMTHVPSQGGLVNPAFEVGQIARAAGLFYLLDATQSVGQMPIDVVKIGCDALCATGRKYLRGPRGTGFLFVKKSELLKHNPPFLDLHSATWTDLDRYEIKGDATRFETWERNFCNLIGLGAAIDYALEWGVEKTWKRIQFLHTLLRQCLSKNPSVTLQDRGREQCGIVTFTLEGFEAPAVHKMLNAAKINVSVSRAEYGRLDLQKRGIPSLVRASVHYYNTEEEITRFCEQLIFHQT